MHVEGAAIVPARWPASRAHRALLGGFLLLLAGCGERALERLPPVADRAAPVTVSGISSGGYMATQFHVAHSALVEGAGLIASGPYRCSEGSLRHALGRCMRGTEPIPVDELLRETSVLALDGEIDPIAALATDRVWILHGDADDTVTQPVVDALQAYYAALVEPRHLARIERPGMGHTFPTRATGAACERTKSPFLGACDYDASGALLAHLLGTLSPADPERPGRLLEFDQRPYADPAGSSGLAGRGWLFVPEPCTVSPAGCRVHVVFHGCKQGTKSIGDRFVKGAGYLEWAATNRLVVLFPQIEPSYVPLNPNGCWDWWGYEGDAFAQHGGAQIAAVRAMIGALRGEAGSRMDAP
jgi:poly(3-hydroxybutyrate) depolymerase